MLLCYNYRKGATMQHKSKTLVIDPITNQVVDVLDIDITHKDAKFIFQVWLDRLAQHRKDPTNNPLPEELKDKIGFLAHWPTVVFAVEIQVKSKLPLWYSKFMPDLVKEEKRLMAEAFKQPA